MLRISPFYVNIIHYGKYTYISYYSMQITICIASQINIKTKLELNKFFFNIKRTKYSKKYKKSTSYFITQLYIDTTGELAHGV